MEAVSRRRALLAGGAVAAVAVPAVAGAGVDSGRSTGVMDTPDDDGRTGRIDVHHHYTPPAWLAWAAGKGLVNPDHMPWWARWDLDATLAMMDAVGVRTAVVNPTLPVDKYADAAQHKESLRVAYQAVAELVAAHPDRFAYFAKLSLDDQEMAVWSARYGLDEQRAAGVCVFTHDAAGRYLGDPVFDPLMAELNERSAVINIHPTELPGISPRSPAIAGVPSFLCDYPLDTTRAAVNMTHKGTLDRFPNVSFILPHGGGLLPYMATRFEISGHLMDPKIDAGRVRDYVRRFYYDTAAPMAPSSTPTLVATADPARILYATDWPATATDVITQAGAAIDADVALDAAKRLGINRGNALRLMPSLATR